MHLSYDVVFFYKIVVLQYSFLHHCLWPHQIEVVAARGLEDNLMGNIGHQNSPRLEQKILATGKTNSLVL